MRNEAIASLLVVAILAGAGAGYLVGYSNQRTTTLTSVSVSTLSVITSYTVRQTTTFTLNTTQYQTEPITTTIITTQTVSVFYPSKNVSYVTPTEPANPSVLVLSMNVAPCPCPPAGPIYNVTIVNQGNRLVTNVTILFENETGSFPTITAGSPLQPGQEASMRFGYVGGFPESPSYPIVIYGTFSDGSPFAFLESIKISG